MSLQATRVDIKRFPASTPPDDFGIGTGPVTVVSEYWVHPSRPDIEVLLKQTRVVLNQDGWEMSSEVEEWIFDTPISAPTLHSLEIWAFVWLPQVNLRQGLHKVQDERTVYDYTNPWIGSKPEYTRTVKAYVIYDLTQSYWNTLDGKPVLDAQKRKIPIAETERRIIDSARTWESALDQASTVENPEAPQRAYWQTVKVERQVIDPVDWRRSITWRYETDYLTGKTTVQGPEEEYKDPDSLELPIVVEAPMLQATDAGSVGIRLEIRGGGAVLESVWPVDAVQHLRPTSYEIYRRTVSTPGPAYNGDPLGLYRTPPGASTASLPLAYAAVKDYAGAPASPLPGASSFDEAEDNSPPDVEAWDNVATVDNAEPSSDLPGHAVCLDADVTAGAVYEYFAVALVGTSSSEDSNHVTATASLDAYGLTVGIRTKPDGSAEVDVLAPPDPRFPEGYGGTVVVPVPAGDVDLSQLGLDVATRRMIGQTARREATLTPSAPILVLERGQRVTVPAVAWETYGRGLHLSSELAALDWRVAGLQMSARRDEQGRLVVEPGTIDLESV